MTIEELRAELLADLTTELSSEENFDETLLDSKIKGAIREVKAARRFPATYTEEMIATELDNFYPSIRELALYDYSKIGAEGQTNYAADGENISYEERRSIFAGVTPICKVM